MFLVSEAPRSEGPLEPSTVDTQVEREVEVKGSLSQINTYLGRYFSNSYSNVMVLGPLRHVTDRVPGL
jgi:hypothetical protein